MHKIQCYRCLAAAWAFKNMFYPVILPILNFIVLGSNSKSLSIVVHPQSGGENERIICKGVRRFNQ
jgi:hypothetical protein